MHVSLLVDVGRRAVGIVVVLDLGAGGADDEARRDSDRDLEVAVVGVELGVRVVLVTVPAALLATAQARRLVDRELGEPLGDGEEIALVAGAREDLRDLGVEVDIDRDLPAGRYRRGERHPRHGAVVGVVVVRVLEGERRQEVFAGRELHGGDLGPAPAIGLRVVAAELATRFEIEGAAVVAEGIPVEMEPEIGYGVLRIGRRIAPDDALVAGDLLRLRVESHRDVVTDDRNRVFRQLRREGGREQEQERDGQRDRGDRGGHGGPAEVSGHG